LERPTKIAYGEVIDRPGLFDIPLGWYHDSCTAGPSISSSGLRQIELYSPAHYWAYSPLNPERIIEADDTEAAYLRVGRAAHMLLLEPDRFKSEIVTRPPQWDSWRTKDSKTWRAAAQAKGMTVLDPREYETVVGIAASLRGSPVHREGILDGHIEASLIWKDGPTGVWLKARPDAIPTSSNMLVDLKVTTDARPRATGRKVRELAYDMQLALAGVGMQRVLGRTVDHCNLVFIETDPPHAMRNAPIGDSMIWWAMRRNRRAINLFATCLRQHDWPGYVETDGMHIDTSDEEQKRYQGELESGLLPKEF
jgi:PDDEXK-like domain of unknown function (DUF3799)